MKNLLFLSVCTFLSISLSAQIITIDNNPGSTTTYQTLQDAHDNAVSGDTIYVQPSTSSYGNVSITKALTIIGRSHSEPGRISTIGNVTIGSSDIVLSGLSVNQISTGNPGSSNPAFSGFTLTECEINSTLNIGSSTLVSSAVTIENVTIRGNHIRSTLRIYGDTQDVILSNNIITTSIQIYNTSSVVISNNAFKSTFTVSIDNYTPTVLIVHNNMFLFNTTNSGGAKITLGSGEFNLTSNLTYNYATSGNNPVFETISGGTFIESGTLANTDPLFNDVNPGDSDSFAGSSAYNPSARLADDLTLQSTSPALTGGSGGSEIGLYNNGFYYDIIGNPKGFPILDVISYEGSVPENGNINVTIKAVAK